ncbi:ABC transporter, ATP-binding protein/peptidase, C39 family [Myxococcus xanthus DK 1622]|uniref:ABC transporter, ATP-binding protein/peptidase, C39 family n=1 Tax=Myxococcus xanthus (strain DK1622) TaxID=246197 RepID=Q1DBD6_MYXXD|nr:ATP-binding cassette domain-containing protein [Myxococcus xanthus]ABF86513.1 ABC transporter, ATP-binding protein/peptidase, C39 family [Myxococcus xanthus DK 1622]NOJ54653.1 ATP-binding cassette domain-containing protein [Myxococcus xanthus]QPM81387.1 ATP-binding cassette domain-containing protein [Myxococcus xanthus]QVW70445.1 ATP-binding cassette domain-containing protein [Myxococcus xanthus DZ2]QZZ49313.1 Vitamin B12 import ATP-binding protein BtuD [Myxococcus xanthus]
MTPPRRRRSIIPEVIQISATDCGPASLKSLFAGMGAELNYRVLREVCQTDVDGTSIVTLDEVANQLGLDAEQVMLPLDHVVVPEAKALPAIIVTLSAGGRPHFVVLWNRVGPFIQVMDPAAGRHWTRISTLLSHLYQHTTSVPATGWREWAGSEEAVATFERRLLNLGATQARALVARALKDPGYLSIARLDAACRASEAMIRAGAVRRGRMAAGLLQSMIAKDDSSEVPIPAAYWSVRPNPEVEGELSMTGAVLMRVRGWREAPREGEDAPRAVLASDLATELIAKQVSPARTLLRLRGEDSWVVPGLIAVGLVFATFGRILQSLMLRGVLDLGRDLGTFAQRATGMAVLAGVALCFMLIQIPISLGLLGIGRRLEVRLRKAYFEKLPEMEDRYFQSRLASDMASRTHNIQAMRSLPPLLAQALVLSLEVASITAALIWAAPHAWRIVLALAAVTLLVPLVAQKLLFEPDLRVQMHAGALSGFTLNALVGLTPIRIHGAERSLRRAQETLLVSWSKARYWLQTLSVGFEGGLMLGSYGLVMLLVYSYLAGTDRASLVLLVVYWALRFPILGQRLMMLSRAFPNAMNRVRRLLDVIGDIKEPPARPEAPVQEPVAPADAASGVSIVMEKVRVKGGGHTILDKVSLNIAPGEHVAVVGVSGAGKSTLVGLLLGWLRPARGEIKVDGQVLDQAAVERLRRTTAWVDPAISLWNQSLIDNLRYGNDGAHGWSLSGALKSAEMLDILEALPDGLQTSLGEGGGLVSGGQGQRVRLARAMLRSGVRLAILDEPFRGLDRDRRARLLAESRRLWADITLLCVTHDVEHTQEFDRVLVIENGRILENGPPKELLANKESRYAVLLRADQENRTLLWGGGRWRHWWLSDGQLVERPAPKPVETPVAEPAAGGLELAG